MTPLEYDVVIAEIDERVAGMKDESLTPEQLRELKISLMIGAVSGIAKLQYFELEADGRIEREHRKTGKYKVPERHWHVSQVRRR